MEVASAIADPVRREILMLLRERVMSAGEIADCFDISRPAVSRHLRVLREAGLVSSRVDAQRRVYSIDPGPLAEIDAWIARFRPFWTTKLDELGSLLEKE